MGGGGRYSVYEYSVRSRTIPVVSPLLGSPTTARLLTHQLHLVLCESTQAATRSGTTPRPGQHPGHVDPPPSPHHPSAGCRRAGDGPIKQSPEDRTTPRPGGACRCACFQNPDDGAARPNLHERAQRPVPRVQVQRLLLCLLLSRSQILRPQRFLLRQCLKTRRTALATRGIVAIHDRMSALLCSCTLLQCPLCHSLVRPSAVPSIRRIRRTLQVQT